MWQLGGNVNIASAHVVMHQKDSFKEVSFELRKIFHNLGVHSVTLQPEVYDCVEGESKCGSAKCCFISDSKKEEISRFVNSICGNMPYFFASHVGGNMLSTRICFLESYSRTLDLQKCLETPITVILH